MGLVTASLGDSETEVKLRTVSLLLPRSISSQTSVMFVASLRAMILYTLSLKLLSEVRRRAVSLSSSMLPSALATANDLECFTVARQWNVELSQWSAPFGTTTFQKCIALIICHEDNVLLFLIFLINSIRQRSGGFWTGNWGSEKQFLRLYGKT